MRTQLGRIVVIGGWLILGLLLLAAIRLTAPRTEQTVTAVGEVATPDGTASPIATQTLFIMPTTCPDDWFTSPSPEIAESCSKGKATALSYQYDLDATAAAISALTPTPPPVITPLLTPLPTLTMEARQARIYQLETVGASIGSPMLLGVNSLWHAGAVPARPGWGYNDLLLYTKPQTMDQPALLGLDITGSEFSFLDIQRYSRLWTFPLETQTITITDVLGPVSGPSGPRGLVSFTSSSGQVGTFDIATQLWSIGGQTMGTPVPTITPDPSPTTSPDTTSSAVPEGQAQP